MDIQILLWLQSLRQMLGPAAEELFVLLFGYGVGVVSLLIPCMYYWLKDRKRGLILMISFVLGNLAVTLVKMTACVYRPWIRDSRIIPAKGALSTAGGYSFPSGHTQSAASVWLALGWLERRKYRWAQPFSCAAVLLVMFARCFLGCHTPQDVLAGLAVSIPLIAVSFKIYALAEQGRSRQILLAALVTAAVSCIYFLLKRYPQDTVNGKLLTDPEEMMESAFASIGYFAGMFSGWYLETKTVCFSAAESRADMARRCLIGIVECAAAYLIIPLAAKHILSYKWVELVRGFMTFLTAVWLVPLTFTKMEEQCNGKSSD